MPSDRRTFIDALIAALQAEVAGASAWVFHRYEPVQHHKDGPRCAVWFNGEARDDATSTTGWVGIIQEYHVRYWEPRPEASGGSVDETAAEAVEVIFDAVKDVIRTRELTPSFGGSGGLRYESGAMLLGGAEEPIRAFEIVVTTRRAEAY